MKLNLSDKYVQDTMNLQKGQQRKTNPLNWPVTMIGPCGGI
jgi:hypothetical protein